MALPAFVECAKVQGGALEKGCAKEGGKGGYVLREGTGKGKPFKGKGGEARLAVPSLGAEIVCSSTKLDGVVGSPGSVSKVITSFGHCVGEGQKCTSPGAKSGSIVSASLSGQVGLLPGGRGGLDLKPEAGSPFVEFSCGEDAAAVEGGLVGEVSPVNQFTKSVRIAFGVNPEGSQLYRQLEGGTESVLSTAIAGAGVFESGLKAETTNKGEDLLLATQTPCVEAQVFSAEWWATQAGCEAGNAELGGVWHPW